MRKLGGVWLSSGETELRRIMGSPGPDAASLDRADLAGLLDGRRGGAKATLMNQRVLAGIGNELSDEILWRARIAPSRRLSELDRRRVDGLHRAMRTALERSMRRGRIVAGRTIYWRERCQR